jgi:hypothetical protein
MPDPDQPKSPSTVKPTKPTAAAEAGTSEGGEVETFSATARQRKTRTYGSQPIKTHTADDETKTHWIEIELVDDIGQPVPGETVEITCPDETVAYGTTDRDGKFKVEGIDQGNCGICFPNLDKDAWEPA